MGVKKVGVGLVDELEEGHVLVGHCVAEDAHVLEVVVEGHYEVEELVAGDCVGYAEHADHFGALLRQVDGVYVHCRVGE